MAPEVITTIPQLRDRVRRARLAERRVGFVPTMGALHAGHRRLMDVARGECDVLIVSVFVNPLQFDRPDDLEQYPRTLENDVDVCAAGGVDMVFAPSMSEMYPSDPVCVIEVGRVADHLCGRFRPGHFRGVATVVMKLMEITQADQAYFGEKDAQQLAVVRRLVEDFNVPIAIVGVPTVREPDGLALSSRNQRLSADERRAAPVLYRALKVAEQLIRSGDGDVAQVEAAARQVIEDEHAVRLEYLQIVEPREMQPVDRIDGPVIAAGAIWVGSTRLIDNVICVPR
ncbi:MAG TPA: pantoate--beta-alanine ligase [Vicinamibacterales bacterium]|jgi:pantoate--beta-alanine ligase|nr:pantoate--beta-alanine ligase [Vicinamibacterales bacterium]